MLMIATITMYSSHDVCLYRFLWVVGSISGIMKWKNVDLHSETMSVLMFTGRVTKKSE